MSTINDGGPAFPMQEPQAIHAYAIAAVDGITDPDERDRAYIKARAEAVGGASECVETAVEYAKVREQFGRTIAKGYFS